MCSSGENLHPNQFIAPVRLDHDGDWSMLLDIPDWAFLLETYSAIFTTLYLEGNPSGISGVQPDIYAIDILFIRGIGRVKHP